jgi:hypothetical protein
VQQIATFLQLNVPVVDSEDCGIDVITGLVGSVECSMIHQRLNIFLKSNLDPREVGDLDSYKRFLSIDLDEERSLSFPTRYKLLLQWENQTKLW